MANALDELTGPTMEEGRDTRVIAKQIPVTIGKGSKRLVVFLYIITFGLLVIKKKKLESHFMQLEQKINTNASEIDNYLEQRVMILQNAAKLLDKAIDLDKTTMVEIAKYRSGSANNEEIRNDIATKMENIGHQISVAFEQYPDLKAHQELADCLQQNSYLQREITAARTVYNDTVNQWNHDVNQWLWKQYVAATAGYTTRVPFATSSEIREQARQVFF